MTRTCAWATQKAAALTALAVILLCTNVFGAADVSANQHARNKLAHYPQAELQGLDRLQAVSWPGYSQASALEMVAYASAVTCPQRLLLEEWKCKVCTNGSFPVPAPPSLQNVTVLVSRDKINQGFVGVDQRNSRVVVSFRGSVDWRQYLFDLDAVLSDEYATLGCEGGCKVHKGFFDAFAELRDATVAAVQERLLNGKRVALTGHSLGAAMATHAALALQKADSEIDVSGITFGQPRVGNPAFAKWANQRLPGWIRVVNYLDPVPQVVKLPGFYAHMATEVWYSDTPRPGQKPLSAFKVCSHDDGEDPSCQNSKCGGFKLCVDGSFHTTYMNMEGITAVDKIC